MEVDRTEYTIEALLDLHDNRMLTVNAEYQRGVVWNETQKKKLIDSVMRGYPLPVIYLHHIQRSVAGMQRDDLEIIDGQQRINALHGFHEGAFKLFHPVEDDARARFPRFLHNEPCPWARLDFHSLPEELKSQFLQTKLPVARIETENINEVRDLFVRLQAGFPLNPQEKRDSLPGGFTDYVLQLGGKPEIARYPGHPFFQDILKMKPGQDRGKTRQLTAQIAMLFFTRRAENGRFVDINAPAIDNFYYTHLDFDTTNSEAKRLREILDKLHNLLLDGRRPKLQGHHAIHLVLLADMLWDDYTRSWETSLPRALDSFMGAVANAWHNQTPNDFLLRYAHLTRVGADRADTIRRRHEFYVGQMLSFLNDVTPLVLKDPRRVFGQLEREVIYFRDQKRCYFCNAEVAWNEAEIHHLQEHSQGGPTVLENGVLVHRRCHPRGRAAAPPAAPA